MTTAREDTTRLADLLRREHHALAGFLVALATFDAERRWVEMGYKSLFDFLRRELKLSAGAAQNRKTAAELIQRFPAVEAALRSGDLCLSSVNELAKVVTPENVAELLPRFFGKSARDAAFLAASIRPVENPPERFVVTPVRGMPSAAAPAPVERGLELHTHEVAAAPTQTGAAAPVLPPSARPTLKPLDAERTRMSLTVPRRLLDKLAAARDALSHSHPGATEEQILEVGLDLILERHAKRRGLVKKPRKPAATVSAPVAATPADAAAAGADAAPPKAATNGGSDLASAPELRLSPRRRRSASQRRRHVALATSPPRSCGRCGSETRGGASSRSRAAASAAPRSASSSTTSTGSPSAARPASRGGACSAPFTRTSTRGRSTGTSS